ncbi:MAG: OmpA family protein [Ignavibacteriae bacterium]|nr:OmpA family protein [Ignavibacteriota bacterium]
MPSTSLEQITHRVRRFVIILCLTMVFVCRPHDAAAQQYQEGRWRLAIDGGISMPGDDFTREQSDYLISPFGGAGIEYFLTDNIGVRADLLGGFLQNKAGDLILKKYYKLTFNSIDYTTMLFVLTAGPSVVTPSLFGIHGVLSFRGGLMYHSTNINFDQRSESSSAVELAFGPALAIEYPLTETLTLGAQYSAMFTTTDHLDGVHFEGSNRDGMSLFTVGVRWTLNAPDLSEKTRPRGESPEFPAPPKTAPGGPPVIAGQRGGDSRSGDDRNGDGSAGNNRGNGQTDGRTTADPDRETGSVEGRDAETARDGNTQTGETASEAAPLPAPRREPVVSPTIAVSDFEGIPGLKRDAESVELVLQKKKSEDINVDVRFELLRDGLTIAQSTRRMTLREPSQKFTAREFLDFAGMSGGDVSTERLPTGEYEMRIGVRPDGSTEEEMLSMRFAHVDYESLFGSDAERVRYLVQTGRSGVSIQPNNEVMFNTFGRDFARVETAGAVDPSAEETASSSGVIREALALAPSGSTSGEKQAFLSALLRESFNKSLVILNAAAKAPGTPERLSTVLGEVYFPFDGAQLTEEGKILLDNVAQLLQQHPELNAEIRGFADEIGDDAYNVLLSQRRADRVYEYLNRKQIPDTRIHSHGVGRTRSGAKASGEQRQRERKVQIVLGEGMP